MVLNLSAPDKNMFIVFIGPLVSSSSLNGLTPLLIETSTMLQVKSLILLDILPSGDGQRLSYVIIVAYECIKIKNMIYIILVVTILLYIWLH